MKRFFGADVEKLRSALFLSHPGVSQRYSGIRRQTTEPSETVHDSYFNWLRAKFCLNGYFEAASLR